MSDSWDLYDWQQWAPRRVIGVDEVGRGCLAGPVYAAAAELNLEQIPEGLTDSKKLSASRREKLSKLILADHRVGLGIATVEEITKLNILRASLLAMKRAVESLAIPEGVLLIDGREAIEGLSAFHQVRLIKGDLRAAPVAAASIVAKVARDEWMKGQAYEYPVYGFERHKGYSTKDHKSAIAEHGPCSLHRPTFAGVREHL